MLQKLQEIWVNYWNIPWYKPKRKWVYFLSCILSGIIILGEIFSPKKINSVFDLLQIAIFTLTSVLFLIALILLLKPYQDDLVEKYYINEALVFNTQTCNIYKLRLGSGVITNIEIDAKKLKFTCYATIYWIGFTKPVWEGEYSWEEVKEIQVLDKFRIAVFAQRGNNKRPPLALINWTDIADKEEYLKNSLEDKIRIFLGKFVINPNIIANIIEIVQHNPELRRKLVELKDIDYTKLLK